MDSSSSIILNPFNYHEQKVKIGILLRSNGLQRVYLALENEPNAIVEKAKWHNRLDESYGLIWISIFHAILFDIDGFTTPNQVWTKFECLFGVQYQIRVNQLENELCSLSLKSFESMEGFFKKFKSLVLFLKQCGIEKKEDQLILSILSKMGLGHLVFVSTFHATWLAIQ